MDLEPRIQVVSFLALHTATTEGQTKGKKEYTFSNYRSEQHLPQGWRLRRKQYVPCSPRSLAAAEVLLFDFLFILRGDTSKILPILKRVHVPLHVTLFWVPLWYVLHGVSATRWTKVNTKFTDVTICLRMMKELILVSSWWRLPFPEVTRYPKYEKPQNLSHFSLSLTTHLATCFKHLNW